MTENKELDQVKEAVGEGKAKYMRPSECRSHMRRTLAKEFQGNCGWIRGGGEEGKLSAREAGDGVTQAGSEGAFAEEGIGDEVLGDAAREKNEKESS